MDSPHSPLPVQMAYYSLQRILDSRLNPFRIQRPIPYLPTELLLSILEYLSARQLWTLVYPASPFLARLATRILTTRDLPRIRLHTNLQDKRDIHGFTFARLHISASDTDEGGREDEIAIFKAFDCAPITWRDYISIIPQLMKKCQDCYAEWWENGNALHYINNVAHPGKNDLSAQIWGKLTLSVYVDDPFEGYRLRKLREMHFDGEKLRARWDVNAGELRLDWGMLLDAYCEQVDKDEVKMKAQDGKVRRRAWVRNIIRRCFRALCDGMWHVMDAMEALVEVTMMAIMHLLAFAIIFICFIILFPIHVFAAAVDFWAMVFENEGKIVRVLLEEGVDTLGRMVWGGEEQD